MAGGDWQVLIEEVLWDEVGLWNASSSGRPKPLQEPNWEAGEDGTFDYLLRSDVSRSS